MSGSPRLFSLCKILSQKHRLTLFAFSDSQERYQTFLDDPERQGVFAEVVLLANPGSSNWWHRKVNHFHLAPYFLTRHLFPEYHARKCQRIRMLFEQGKFDVLFADGLGMAQYVMESNLDCPAIIDLHDSLSLLFSRIAQIERNWLTKLFLYAQTRSIRRWEKSLSTRFSAVIVNSRVDQAVLKSRDPSGNIVAVGNGVDSEFFTPRDVKSNITKLVFTGVMDYDPNEDAAIYFCDAILPAIQERYPQMEFWVVGKDPTERVRMLAQRPGVHVTGGVPDVRPFLETAGIFVCPLRFGSGVKNKILAALAMGKAVVATRVSLEGLDLREDEHVLAAHEPGMFAAQVIRLIEDPGMATRLARSGQAFVRAEYSWERSATLMEGLLLDAVNHQHKSDGRMTSPRYRSQQ